jgi:hypothetical protein
MRLDPRTVGLFALMLNRLRKKFTGNTFNNRLSRAGEDSEHLHARDRIQAMLSETEA